MDKDIWIMKHKAWSIIIALLIIFSISIFFLPKNSKQIDLTGKVIDESVQNTSEQEEIFSSSQPEENSQTNEEINNDEQIQEEENCEYKYLDEYRCEGNNVQREYQYSDCSFDWFYSEFCVYGCENGKCKDCYDSDGGKDYYTKGYIIHNDGTKEYDECSTGAYEDYVWEHYCVSGGFGQLNYKCPYGCTDGKCNLELEEQSDYFTVTYIVDGDTLDVDTGERVRLICINTPERGEYYYSEAKEYLKSLTLNKEVDLIKDISETDRYGRLLRYIYLTDGTFVNELMVRNGYGRAYPYYPDTTLCPQIENAEEIARENHLGIWAEEEEKTPPNDSGYICSYNAYNCADFSTHAQAQAVFEACGGLSNDVHWLDGDNDGIACENLP